MSIPVFVEQENGQFIAAMVGMPEVHVAAATREAALAGLRTILEKRMADGEIALLEVKREGILASAGMFRDDPTLSDIRDEIYRQRDAEPKE